MIYHFSDQDASTTFLTLALMNSFIFGYFQCCFPSVFNGTDVEAEDVNDIEEGLNYSV